MISGVRNCLNLNITPEIVYVLLFFPCICKSFSICFLIVTMSQTFSLSRIDVGFLLSFGYGHCLCFDLLLNRSRFNGHDPGC